MRLITTDPKNSTNNTPASTPDSANIKRKTELRTVVKQYKKLVASGEKDKAKEYLSNVYKKFDKTAKSKLIKKNKASRMKSRLSKMLK